MNGHNKRGRFQRWSNLPTQILRSIAKLLENDTYSLRHFRLVCKNWNHSTAIPILLPHHINTHGSNCCVYASTVYLVNPSWIVLFIEPIKNKYRYRQLFSGTIFDKFPYSDFSRFQSRHLCTEYHLSFDPISRADLPIVKALVCSIEPVPCTDYCAIFGLRNGGKLGVYPPLTQLENDDDDDGNDADEGRVKFPWIEISYGCVDRFHDIVEYRGMILAVDPGGKLYEIDLFSLDITSAYLDRGVPTTDWRSRLVGTPAGDLYLVVKQSPKSKQYFKVYMLSHSDKSRGWVEVDSFGDRVMFVTQDCCFFVGVDGSGQNLKNCIVYSKFAFPLVGVDRWASTPRHKDEVGFFRLDGDGEDGSFRPISSFRNFPFVLDSCPLWSRQPPASSHSESQRELEEDDSESREDEGNRETGRDEEEESGSCNGDDESSLNFRGLNVCPGSVPILEKIWLKHGDVMEKIAICNGDIIARALESLAYAVQILEDNTGRSLNDEEAEYLSSTLGDLQLMRFRVDWLAPKINDAVTHHKSRHLMSVFDSIKGVTRAKARISERRAKLEEEMADCDQTEKELDSEMTKLHESISCLGQELDFDKPLGGLI